ncbi:insulinase family protein [Clostridium tagluense]|uniref:insulinase family protein n=1 Tax=Clostridium tagluense TaxID=360422 RepID=UPI001C6E3BF8|nr:insulinase family protein [Clostridium tagluense]MBW9156139.1 insulinase family protein [Clostridium tagluense]MCB2311281.1 insulinase family protein [Clostridium tagluense]MCB2316077.1 insulinase family protein [Clostridium tagluense]MCB2320857.1 insulinase family protein [Clostridium tagluense]MCB2325946.1 insulinase family protein [Clostridium tagluense]
MKFTIGSTYHGFKLIQEKNIEELNSVTRLFEHEKSGARLLHLENDDDNKVFSIGFRTPPKSSNGLPHILEHSVLCGSRKFPTKEPFVELIKGSLNTFLNAMTFSDKTIYPLASKNEKDFFNLMDVYLDAVFYPNLYSQREILMQEGWHYELENKEDKLSYKGVVYNEMKGAFSSPEGCLMRKIQESLFPDTSYGVESGGDPEFIPDLTQEEFVEFHKKYYHPSNSYIFLYGDGNIDKELQFISEKYLNDFDRISVDSAIQLQKPFSSMSELKIDYPISSEDDEKDKSFLSMNFVSGDNISQPELHLAFEILEYLLLESAAAPLKRALVEADLGKDVFGSFDNSILQPVFSIVVKNSNEAKKEEFKEIVYTTLKNLVKDGIDKKLIEACINITEFKLREADLGGFPKGLFYYITSMDSWLYDKDPTMHLEYESYLSKIKAALTTNYFENLIEKYLINNTHSSMVILNGKKGLAEQKSKAVEEKLARYKASISDSEIEKIVQETKALKERQMTPDTVEVLETIPLLERSDIETTVEHLPLKEKDENGVKVLSHNIFTNKIAYINILFDAKKVDMELLPYVTLLSTLLGRVSTESTNYPDLSNEINIHTGGIHFTTEVYGDNENFEKYSPKLVVKSKALVPKLPKLFDIMAEIINTTKFDEKKRLKELIQQLKSRQEMKILDRGHMAAAGRLTSYFSPASAYIEKTTGVSFYEFINDIERNFDNKADEIIENLNKVSKLIFNKNNLIVSITGEEDIYTAFAAELPKIISILGQEELPDAKYDFALNKNNEGLLSSSDVQYVAKGYNFIKQGYAYSGKMLVLKTIASLDYLWNRVRVQGGAYGGFANLARSGNIVFVSYRDPNVSETLKAYDGICDYIGSFEASEREMTKYIIGTISELDSPLTPSMKGERATAYYIRGISEAQRQMERDEVLSTKSEDIKSFKSLLDDIIKENCFCVLGNENKLKDNKDIFTSLVNVFK